jgi:hypothetical protein
MYDISAGDPPCFYGPGIVFVVRSYDYDLHGRQLQLVPSCSSRMMILHECVIDPTICVNTID